MSRLNRHVILKGATPSGSVIRWGSFSVGGASLTHDYDPKPLRGREFVPKGFKIVAVRRAVVIASRWGVYPEGI